MTVSLKIASFPLLITMALASSSVFADGLFNNLIRDRALYGTPAGTGQHFYNYDHNDRLRHRVNPLYSNHEQGKHQYRNQHGKQSKYQYRYREQSSGPHRNQSSSMGRGSGGGRGR